MGWVTITVASVALPQIIVVISGETRASKSHVRPAFHRLALESGRQTLT